MTQNIRGSGDQASRRDTGWEVEYETQVVEWLDELQDETYAVIVFYMDLLKILIDTGSESPMLVLLNEYLTEYRIKPHQRKQHGIVYYLDKEAQLIVLLHGFTLRGQHSLSWEYAKAQRAFQDYLHNT